VSADALCDVGEPREARRVRPRAARPREWRERRGRLPCFDAERSGEGGELEIRGVDLERDVHDLARLLVPRHANEDASEAEVRGEVPRLGMHRFAKVRFREHVTACTRVRLGTRHVPTAYTEDLFRRCHSRPCQRGEEREGDDEGTSHCTTMLNSTRRFCACSSSLAAVGTRGRVGP
jgi:hypothetical protein